MTRSLESSGERSYDGLKPAIKRESIEEYQRKRQVKSSAKARFLL